MIRLTGLVCAVLLAVVECSSDSSAVSLLYKSFVTCADSNILTCLSNRATHLLDRASSLDKLPIWGDSVVLVRANLENATSADLKEPSTERSIGESFNRFLETRRLQLRLPPLSYFIPTTGVTGRGKKGNKGYGLIAMTIVGAMMATGMAGLAMMAGKALAASMAALLLAAIAAMRKGGGGGHHHDGHSSYEVISIPSHQHRSFLDEQSVRSPYKYDVEEHIPNKKR